MANANQSANRAGNVFGREAGAGFAGNDWENIVLKPGYIIKVRDRFHLVEAVEGLTVDLFFNDSFTFTVAGGKIDAADDGNMLLQYGDESMQTALVPQTTTPVGNKAYPDTRANILKPSYDSGFIEFKDLEPYRGHLYHLCPSVPTQPKFIDIESGNWLVPAGSATGLNPDNGGTPMGFKASGTAEHNMNVGTISPKVYLRHPAGVPKWVLDEAPEGSSGSVRVSSTLEGLSGFIDGQISPVEDPDWTYSIWIESGENNLPSFKMVNDTQEVIIDGRLHLQGWKYRIVELGMDQLKQIRDRSGGRLTFKIVTPGGIPTPGTLLADYFPR
tara:strand:+ start:2970 stop:3956 length:987 start_codon:yes stop_codon:yes gene_type:complete